MARIANFNARKLVQSLTPFQGSNLFAEDKFNSYIVYSYGYHHPLYVFNRITKQWYKNTDKYSRTTSKHAGQTHPYTDLRYGSTQALERVIYRDDDSYTILYPEHKTKQQRQRDPERETINVVKVADNYWVYSLTVSHYASGREHYIDTLPKYLQHKVSLIKLLPPGAYLDDIGGMSNSGVIILNITKPTQS